MNNLSSQSIRTSISSSPSVESVPYRLRPAETIGESFPSRCPPPICMKLACYGTRPQSGPRAAARVSTYASGGGCRFAKGTALVPLDERARSRAADRTRLLCCPNRRHAQCAPDQARYGLYHTNLPAWYGR